MSNSFWNFTTSLVAGLRAKASAVNTLFSNIAAGFDSVETEINKAIRVTTSPGTVTISADAASRAGKVIAFDDSGDVVLLDDTENNTAAAAASAAAAAASAAALDLPDPIVALRHLRGNAAGTAWEQVALGSMADVDIDAAPTAEDAGKGLRVNAAGDGFVIGDFTLVKAANEVINSDNTLSADDTLLFTPEAGKLYRFKAVLFCLSNTTADFSFAVNSAGINDEMKFTWRAAYNDGTSEVGYGASGTPVNLTVADINGFAVVIEGIYDCVGPVTSTVRILWAQGTSDAGNTSVSKHSYMSVEELQ